MCILILILIIIGQILNIKSLLSDLFILLRKPERFVSQFSSRAKIQPSVMYKI
jgi:hypothetical protein